MLNFIKILIISALLIGADGLADGKYKTNVAFIREVHRLINAEREKEGLPAYRLSRLLTKAAQDYSLAMAEHNFVGHCNPNTQSTYPERIFSAGYPKIMGTFVGENVARGAETPAELVQGWMNSPTHRANILDRDFTEHGIGFIQDTDDWELVADVKRLNANGEEDLTAPGYECTTVHSYMPDGHDLPYEFYWVQTFGNQNTPIYRNDINSQNFMIIDSFE